MKYTGRVLGGVVVFDGPERPPEGAEVHVILVAQPAHSAAPVGEGLARLAGTARGLPADLADRHDDYRRGPR